MAKELAKLNGATFAARLEAVQETADAAHLENIARTRTEIDTRIMQLVSFRVAQAVDAVLGSRD